MMPSNNRPSAGLPADHSRRFLGALLFLVVAGVFLPAVGHDFISYDDPAYVTQNPHVQAGLSWETVRWAFRSMESSNWHPVTWLSHLLDGQIYGVKPWGHHLTSVLLHACNALMLFGLLRKMTGAVWRSLFVAALFGLHPLHVESVAWVAERKDVLSTGFLLLTLWAYARRVEALRAGASGAAAKWQGGALLFFTLGLMSKPMLVTLPAILLLLDFWPLNRWNDADTRGRWRLWWEKIPFFVLSAGSSAVTLLVQNKGGAVASLEDFSLPVRIGNALLAYCVYLWKCFVPQNLAVFYPNFAEEQRLWQVLAAVVVLGAITVMTLVFRRSRSYLPVGWLWFVGTLVPVIGLVQVGGQTMADRYTYVPLVGIFIIVAWGAVDWVGSSGPGRRALGIAAIAVVLGAGVATSRQLDYWKNDLTLFRHAVTVTDNNYVAHANLFMALAKTSPAEADIEFQRMRRILATFAEKFERKGIALSREPGREEEAIKEFRTAIRIIRDIPGPHFNLGLMLAQTPERRAEAVGEFRTAVRLKPDHAEAWYSLALLLSETPEKKNDAIFGYQMAVRAKPGYFEAHYNLGLLLMDDPGRKAEALTHFQAALQAKPDLAQAREMIERLQAP